MLRAEESKPRVLNCLCKAFPNSPVTRPSCVIGQTSYVLEAAHSPSVYVVSYVYQSVHIKLRFRHQQMTSALIIIKSIAFSLNKTLSQASLLHRRPISICKHKEFR